MAFPGDLDEAVSGLLTDGLAASDVNGETVPSGFSRVDAFRTGVLGGEQACEDATADPPRAPVSTARPRVSCVPP